VSNAEPDNQAKTGAWHKRLYIYFINRTERLRLIWQGHSERGEESHNRSLDHAN